MTNVIIAKKELVFDASTLILIAKADLLDLFLRSINLPVAIPSELEKECCGFKKALDAIIIQKALDESRIKVFALRNRRLVAKLQTDFSLGKGEAEAIALALDRDSSATKRSNFAFPATTGLLKKRANAGKTTQQRAAH
jgi:predicted nucleic acid-binding protein